MPSQAGIGYETGDVSTGCNCYKCAKGYAYHVYNSCCTKGHYNTGAVAGGYNPCPHGYHTGKIYWYAHCIGDNGHDTHGYRAPCGRTTTKTDDVYGYVTRTRTTTYNKILSSTSTIHLVQHICPDSSQHGLYLYMALRHVQVKATYISLKPIEWIDY